MQASTSFLRLLWRAICWKAADESLSLEEVLKSILIGKTEQVAGGMYVTHSSIGGQSVAFNTPPSNDLTLQDIAEAYSFLYDAYERIKNCVADPGAADEEICALMLARLVPRKRIVPDFAPYGGNL